ncbi:MAG TPA: DUF6458 family protein [Acidimicrobiales bacterium]|nr:DUF6458 family protein [Acidimicrobiales bacterium]
MGIGVSLFLLALGAILTFAVEAEVEGLELETVGVILMVVGALGMLLSMMFWSTWGGVHRRVIHEGPGGRRTIDDREL